jgi:hypothetical protein
MEDLEYSNNAVLSSIRVFHFLPVQQLGLQSSPERLDHGVIEGIADGAHRGDEAGLADAFAEGPGRELGSVIAMDHRSARGVRLLIAI